VPNFCNDGQLSQSCRFIGLEANLPTAPSALTFVVYSQFIAITMSRNLGQGAGAKPVQACHFEVSLKSVVCFDNRRDLVLTRVRHVSRPKARAISLA
jgi:hypothetical protein